MSDEAKETDELIDNDDLDIEAASEKEEVEETKPENEEVKPPSIEELTAKIDALSKEKDGMYREMVSERKTRQEIKGQLDAIKDMMAAARANRESMITESAEKAVDSTTTKSGIPVSFDDNGNPFIAKKDLAELTSSELEKVKRELETIKSTNFHQTAVDQNRAILGEILNEDERYQAAFAKVQKAYGYLDKKTGEVMRKYGLELNTTSLDEVMVILEKEHGDEFSDMFPGLDIDVVVEAFTTGPNGLLRPRKISKAIRTVVSSEGEGEKSNQKIKNLKFIASKPSNLSGARNQKGSSGRTLDDIANMDIKDFESMTDADFQKLERAMRRLGA